MERLIIQIDMISYEIEIEDNYLTIKDIWNAREIHNEEIDFEEFDSLTNYIIEIIQEYNNY